MLPLVFRVNKNCIKSILKMIKILFIYFLTFKETIQGLEYKVCMHSFAGPWYVSVGTFHKLAQ